MDFSLTEEQTLIAEAAADVLQESAGHAQLESAIANAQGFDESLWLKLSQELGWCGLSIAEEHGGIGLGAVEMALVLEQAGKHLLVSPFFSTVALAATVIAEVGTPDLCSKFLPGIASGEKRFGIALPSSLAGWDQPGSPKTIRVLDADAPDGLILSRAQRDGGSAWFQLPAEAVEGQLNPVDSWDPTRRIFDLELAQVSWGDAERLDSIDSENEGAFRAASLARLYVAAEQLGGAQACLDLTVAYTLERKQFGRVIAGFQAVKHRCAQMMVMIESLRSQVLGAAACADDEKSSSQNLFMECAAARAMAIETSRFCSQEAIQLHGGVGFTWEFAPHWHFKRAQSSCAWLGDLEALREAMATHLLDAGAVTT